MELISYNDYHYAISCSRMLVDWFYGMSTLIGLFDAKFNLAIMIVN